MRPNVHFLFVLSFGLANFAFSQAAPASVNGSGKNQTPPASSPPKASFVQTRSAQIEGNVGNMLADGTLGLSWLIGEIEPLRLLGVRFILDPEIAVDPFNHVRSTWRIIGLQTSLAPEGRDMLRWQAPGGATVIFRKKMIDRAFGRAGQQSGWRIRRVAPDVFELQSGDGTIWRYADGSPVSVEHPMHGKLLFVMQGALVREIRKVQPTLPGQLLVQAEYDDAMRIQTLTIGPDQTHRFNWNGAGELHDWQHANGATMGFAYGEGLLTGISLDGEQIQSITWRENPGWDRSNSIWPAPVHLASDSQHTYSYLMTRKGFVLQMIDRVSGKQEEKIYRPTWIPYYQGR